MGSFTALCYHHVGSAPRSPWSGLSVSPDRFAKQIGWLKAHGYASVSLHQLLDWLRTDAELPRRTVLITFDDGYADLDRYAYPVLESAGFHALTFIVTGMHGGFNEWDVRVGAPSLPLLTTEQIGYWIGRGFEFGGHTRSHTELPAAGTEMEAEVAGCADDLAEVLGARPIAFAYPYGAFDDRVCETVAANFSLAFTVEEGRIGKDAVPHRLRRSNVLSNDTMLDFRCRVELGFSPVQRLRSILRFRSRVAGLKDRWACHA